MRRSLTLLMTLIAFVTSSCDDKFKEEVADRIVLSRSSVAFAMEGGTTTVSVASLSPWEAACPDNWVTLHQEGDHLTITTTGNITEGTRDAKVTVKSASSEQEITVQQAFSRETIILSTTAAEEEILFDSEGESVLFAVITNGNWKVGDKPDWLEVISDPASGTIRLIAPANPTSHRNAKVTILSTRGSASASCEITVSQISHAENAYYQMLGYYGLYAENWYYGRDPLNVGGTGTFCTIEQKEYRKSFYIKDLFLKGAVVEASYDKNSKTMSIELGRLCYVREISTGVTRLHFLHAINMQTASFHSAVLTGVLGEGYNDDADENRKAILLSGFEAPYTSLGITGYQGQQWMSFGDLYYATGSMYFVQWDKPVVTTGVTQAASAITPSGKDFPIYEN